MIRPWFLMQSLKTDGDRGAQARAVGEAMVHDAFHNVSFFDCSIADVHELYE